MNFSGMKGMSDFVRRKRWVRTCMTTPDTSAQQLLRHQKTWQPQTQKNVNLTSLTPRDQKVKNELINISADNVVD